MTRPMLLLLLGLGLISEVALAARFTPSESLDIRSVEAIAAAAQGKHSRHKRKKEITFSAPSGIFIQERASKQLPGPGQHFSFGALLPWERIHQLLEDLPDSKLVLMVRHGQAMSNYLSDTLGPDEWFKVEETCTYTAENGTEYGVFDAELTGMGEEQARSLNSMLAGGGWFTKLTQGKPTRAVVSPLSRCLNTALLVTNGLNLTQIEVEENIRETLGEDTCDARRSVSDPNPKSPDRMYNPCPFSQGLRSKFPMFKFPVLGSGGEGQGFGLISDKDTMWTKDREEQDHQVARAKWFLQDMFDYVKERVVLVVTHSGTARSILLAAGREPYRPQNTELLPLLVQRSVPVMAADAGADAE